MPDTDSTRKRSRSPSDSDHHKNNKRANTGAPHLVDDILPGNPDPASSDLNMTEPSAAAANDDNSSSTPGSNDADKAKEGGRGDKSSSATASAASSSSTSHPPAPPPSAQIHMRCLIVTQDASIIIGRGGTHVNEIREKSGARVVVSESIPGNPERILNVSGPLDAVSKVGFFSYFACTHETDLQCKAFGLIVRRINDEPFDVPSVPGSRAVTIKFMIPNSRMGSVIGKQGCKIKEIQEASGARLNASEGMLPGSTEVPGIPLNLASFHADHVPLLARP
jgi:heterogeneous nuclear rnp K-like protein 2